VRQKKVSRGNITDGISPSVISRVITDGITDEKPVGKDGMALLQLSVNYRQIISVGNAVGINSPTDSIRRQSVGECGKIT
jgi:hypothetical protein